MARPRQFDEDAVLGDALGIFWAHGYDGASLHRLLAGTGLTRGSFYKAFVDKRTLFLRIVDLYDATEVEGARAILSDPRGGSGAMRIAGLFDGVARGADPRGCLLCTALAGPAATDPVIGERVRAAFVRIEDGFRHALAIDGQDDTAAVLAGHLMVQYVGLRGLARGGMAAEELLDRVQGVRRVLGIAHL